MVLSVAFSPDGRTLASTGEDGMVVLWNVETRQPFQVLRGHTGIVRSVRFSPTNNQVLITGSEDKTVRSWDLQTSRSTILHESVGRIFSVAFCPQGEKLAIAGESEVTGESGTIVLRNIRTIYPMELQEGSYALEEHSRRVRAIRFHPTIGTILASGSEDGAVKLWNLNTRQYQILEGHRSSVRSVLFSPNGDVLASCGQDGTIKLWDVQTCTHLRTLQSPSPYQGSDFTSVTGLSSAQKAAFKHLGAIGVE